MYDSLQEPDLEDILQQIGEEGRGYETQKRITLTNQPNLIILLIKTNINWYP